MEIAPWLEEHINKNCPYCGAPIVNNQLLTDRFCSNEKCPEHMAQKIVVLAKRLDVKNFGIASAREAVRLYKFQLHTQIIPHWFKEKPSLYLHEVGEICLIKGHQKKWRQYCEGHDTMLQVLRSPRTPPEIRKQGVLLICTAAMCNIKPRLLGKRLNVMLSGSFDGYRSRSDFVAEMNRKYGDVVQLVDVGKRKTEVAFLIKEAHATDHEKSAIANAMGITIITPKAFNEKLEAYRSYILEGRGES